MDSTADAAPPPVPKPAGFTRWIVCFILFLAVVLSYIDRQVLSVLKPDLARTYHWTEEGYSYVAIWFQAVYGIAFLISGRIIDRIGAKAGYALAMTLWTIGHMLQAAVTSTTGMIFARIPLATGEAATYPAALIAANSWFPRRERALAIGILNAGANIGAIVTPLIVPMIVLVWGWRAAFIVTGSLSVGWLAVWLLFYRTPRRHPLAGAAEVAWIEADQETREKTTKVSILRLLGHRQTWAYMCGRFLIDPVWWTFLAWLPSFLNKQFHVQLSGYFIPLASIYIMADIGSITGGFLSSRFIRNGWHINTARKTAMLIMACVVLPVAAAGFVPQLWMAVVCVGLACAGHQGFSTNLFTIPGDLYPHWASGTVAGLGGLAGAAGGILMALFAGRVLQATGGNYSLIFIVSSVMYLLAFVVVHLLCPRWDQVVLERKP